MAFEVYPPIKTLFEPLYDLLRKHRNKNIKIINCFHNFTENDFVDLLHLNMNGAEKITKIINKYIDKV